MIAQPMTVGDNPRTPIEPATHSLLAHVQATMRDLAGDMSDGALLDAYDGARWGLSALCDDIATLDPLVAAIQLARIDILAAVLSERAKGRMASGGMVRAADFRPESRRNPEPPAQPSRRRGVTVTAKGARRAS